VKHIASIEVDHGMRETLLIAAYLISPVRAPMDRDDRDVSLASERRDLISDLMCRSGRQIWQQMNTWTLRSSCPVARNTAASRADAVNNHAAILV
jgi:hypothetical protein